MQARLPRGFGRHSTVADRFVTNTSERRYDGRKGSGGLFGGFLVNGIRFEGWESAQSGASGGCTSEKGNSWGRYSRYLYVEVENNGFLVILMILLHLTCRCWGLVRIWSSRTLGRRCISDDDYEHNGHNAKTQMWIFYVEVLLIEFLSTTGKSILVFGLLTSFN